MRGKRGHELKLHLVNFSILPEFRVDRLCRVAIAANAPGRVMKRHETQWALGSGLSSSVGKSNKYLKNTVNIVYSVLFLT